MLSWQHKNCFCLIRNSVKLGSTYLISIKYVVTEDTQILCKGMNGRVPALFIWIQLLCLCWIRNRFTCLVNSKSIKQVVSHEVKLPITNWVFSGCIYCCSIGANVTMQSFHQTEQNMLPRRRQRAAHEQGYTQSRKCSLTYDCGSQCCQCLGWTLDHSTLKWTSRWGIQLLSDYEGSWWPWYRGRPLGRQCRCHGNGYSLFQMLPANCVFNWFILFWLMQ